MSNWIEIYEGPYGDENELLNTYVESLRRRVSWETFHRQEDIVFMTNETENGLPKLKEGAIEVINDIINREMSYLREYLLNRELVSLLKSNVDISEEAVQWFEDELEEDGYQDFQDELDRFIWADYAKHLGEERTAELWEKWGKNPLKED